MKRDEKDARTLDDGFGNVWKKCNHEDCRLEIVRPGKVQCDRCRFPGVNIDKVHRER